MWHASKYQTNPNSRVSAQPPVVPGLVSDVGGDLRCTGAVRAAIRTRWMQCAVCRQWLKAAGAGLQIDFKLGNVDPYSLMEP